MWERRKMPTQPLSRHIFPFFLPPTFPHSSTPSLYFLRRRAGGILTKISASTINNQWVGDRVNEWLSEWVKSEKSVESGISPFFSFFPWGRLSSILPHRHTHSTTIGDGEKVDSHIIPPISVSLNSDRPVKCKNDRITILPSIHPCTSRFSLSLLFSIFSIFSISLKTSKISILAQIEKCALILSLSTNLSLSLSLSSRIN